MKQIIFFLSIFGISLLIGCHKGSNPIDGIPTVKSPIVLYTNSFESSLDTIGWKGSGFYRFYPESAPNCGTQSLCVTGGDVAPQAMTTLPPLTKESRIILQLWARCLHWDGSVRLSAITSTTPMPTIWVSFQDSLWKQYSDTLLMPVGCTMELSLDANGKKGGEILVDQITVLQITE